MTTGWVPSPILDPASPIEITLKYQGHDVDDGTMSIGDVISALQGFSAAYGKLANRHDPSGQHQIRVADVNKSSFALLILAWVSQNPKDVLQAASLAVPWIISTLIKLIDLKKALKGQHPAVSVTGNGNVTVSAGGNLTMIMSKETFDVFESGLVDAELAKIARPIEKGKIETAELAATDKKDFNVSVEIGTEDKAFFQAPEHSSTSTSKPVTLAGSLVSLNKEKNRGLFRMQNGNSVSYRFVGDDLSNFYLSFAFKGPVHVECIATFNEDLEVKSLDISNVTPIQSAFPFHGTPDISEHPSANEENPSTHP